MTDLPQPWRAYARLQAELARERVVNDRSWALESGLDRLLAGMNLLSTEDELRRSIRSEGRKERARARLRRIFLSTGNAYKADDALDARQQLREAQEQVSDKDWALLHAVGEGRDYCELAGLHGGSVGSLRVRVLRLRRELKDQQRGFASGAGERSLSRPTAA